MQEREAYIQKQQRWLLFLRHCAKCQLDETECQFSRGCGVGTELWTHILQCNNPACTVPRCTSNKDLLKHHQHCKVGRQFINVCGKQC
jgi:E1A/CREB-binding protein